MRDGSCASGACARPGGPVAVGFGPGGRRPGALPWLSQVSARRVSMQLDVDGLSVEGGRGKPHGACACGGGGGESKGGERAAGCGCMPVAREVQGEERAAGLARASDPPRRRTGGVLFGERRVAVGRSAGDPTDEVPSTMTRELWDTMSRSERLRWVQEATRQSRQTEQQRREFEANIVNRGFDALREGIRAIRDVRVAEVVGGSEAGLRLLRNDQGGILFGSTSSLSSTPTTTGTPQPLTTTQTDTATKAAIGLGLVWLLMKGSR